MSAIDWLSNSVAMPTAMPNALADSPFAPTEPPVTGTAAVGDVTVQSLNRPRPDGVGLLPGSVTGLPRNLWGATATHELVRLIRAARGPALPALQDLMYTILLAEVDPPLDADSRGTLLMARLDWLIELGALDQAQALLERAGPTTPELFRLWFDVALLTGTEDRGCTTLRDIPGIAPTFSVRIFCLARNGDWPAAALTLHTAQALGYVNAFEDALLSRFLDPDLADGEPPLTPPSPISPLVFRMLEAIGEAMATTGLPQAFAHSDLRDTAGWKAQLEAAERLGRTGAISENRILALYTERKPAASGGIWDRVEAVQAFDAAITASDPAAVAATLPAAVGAMHHAGLVVDFAKLYGDRLASLPLTGAVESLAFQVMLLSDGYETLAAGYRPKTPMEAFEKSIATGTPTQPPAGDALARAITEAFAATEAPQDYAVMLSGNRLGEAILTAIQQLNRGASGQVSDVAEGLALLRAVGLDDVARRVSLQLMLQERRP